MNITSVQPVATAHGTRRREQPANDELWQAQTVINTWQQQTEQFRQKELERLFSRVALSEHERALVISMSRALVEKILEPPALRLQQEAAGGNGERFCTAVRHLFALEQHP